MFFIIVFFFLTNIYSFDFTNAYMMAYIKQNIRFTTNQCTCFLSHSNDNLLGNFPCPSFSEIKIYVWNCIMKEEFKLRKYYLIYTKTYSNKLKQRNQVTIKKESSNCFKFISLGLKCWHSSWSFLNTLLHRNTCTCTCN